MRKRREFTKEFKRRIVEKILSGTETQAALSRKYNIAHVVLYRWKKEYAEGKLYSEPSTGTRKQDARVAQLEQMVGRLTMEKEALKITLGICEQASEDNQRVSKISKNDNFF